MGPAHDAGPPDAAALEVVESVLAGRTPLDVHVQPIVDLVRGTVVGHEALSRFPDLRPDVAFDVAGQVGRRADLQALAVAAVLRRRPELPPNTFLTVNVDPVDLADPRLLTVLLEHTPLTRVVIELTEHSAVDLEATAELLGELRRAGAMIAADDVGAGYAGMQALLALRPQLLKLDRALICDLDRDPVRQEMVRMLGDLAGRMDAWLLAEGIETTEELDVLCGLGVPLGQGYLLGRPGPGFGAPEPVIQARIRLAALDRPDRTRIASLVERVVVSRPGETRTDRTLDGPVVDVDGLDRPLRVRMPAAWGPCEEYPLVVQTTEPVDALAARLAVRIGRLPAVVVVTNPTGAVIGIVRPQRLLAALLDGPDEADRTGAASDRSSAPG